MVAPQQPKDTRRSVGRPYFPFLFIILAFAVFFLAPNLSSILRGLVGIVALLLGAVLYLLTRANHQIRKAKFLVKVNEVSFDYFERNKAERPPASQSITSRYDEALQEQRRGNFRTASELFLGIFADKPDYWPAKIQAGVCFQFNGDFDEVLLEYSHVINNCAEPKFLQQALGNTGEVLVAQARSETVERAATLREEAYHYYKRAESTQSIFVSIYNCWTICNETERLREAGEFLEKLKATEEFKNMSDEKKRKLGL